MAKFLLFLYLHLNYLFLFHPVVKYVGLHALKTFTVTLTMPEPIDPDLCVLPYFVLNRYEYGH
jgi:hypothetical protein